MNFDLQNFKLDYPTDEDESPPVPPASIVLQIPEFTENEIVAASVLKKYSPASRHLALFIRTTGENLDDYLRPSDEWTTTMTSKFSAVIGQLNASRVEVVAMGKVVPDDLKFLMAQDPDRIKASLLAPKRSSETTHTDATLAPLVVSQLGAVITKSGENGLITVPGAPLVEVAISGPSQSRVVKGMKEWAMWYNTKFNHKIRCYEIDSVVRTIAGMFLVKELPGIVAPGKPISYKARTYPPPGSMISFPPMPDKFLKCVANLRNIVAWGYTNFKDGLSVGPRSDPRSFVELCVTRSFEANPDLCKAFSAVAADYLKFVKGVRDDAMKTFSIVTPKHLYDGLAIPGVNVPLVNQGKTRDYVNVHRQHYRHPIDVPRKHDSPGLANIADGSTSVPAKFQLIFDFLREIWGDDFPKEILAVGTHKSNHWSKTMIGSFPGATIMWADQDPSFRPAILSPNDTNWRVFDIVDAKSTEPGWARGKMVFDDTQPEIRVGIKGVSTAYKLKLDRLAVSEAEVVVCKLMYGADDFQNLAVFQVPPAILALGKVYTTIRLFPGGGPHSPEYFVVASKGPRIWWPKSSKPGLAPSPNDNGEFLLTVGNPQLWEQYAGSWMAFKAADLVRGNVSQSVQAALGIYLEAYQPYIKVKSPDRIVSGGVATGAVASVSVVGPVADSSHFALE